MKRHIMLDNETMGKGPRSAIASIGAVVFDPFGEDIDGAFYQRVELRSSVAAGLVIDADTVMWWLKQSDEAREELLGEDALPLHLALHDLRHFMLGLNLDFNPDDLIVWANGASFDFPILNEAYRLVGSNAPWKFCNERDWRTVRKLFPLITLERTGTLHSALDDAIHQAKHLQLILRTLRELGGSARHAIEFIMGFEDDPMQTGIPAMLARLNEGVKATVEA